MVYESVKKLCAYRENQDRAAKQLYSDFNMVYESAKKDISKINYSNRGIND